MGLVLVLAASACAEGSGDEGTRSIAQAQRRIEAGDHEAALTILEDALVEARVQDKPAVLDLLRQCYAILARNAEDSGRAQDAAHYRDNLAILDRARERPRPAPSSGLRPETPVRSRTDPNGPKSGNAPLPRRALPDGKGSRPGGAGFRPVNDAVLPAPAPLPEPMRLPPPGSLPSSATAGAAASASAAAPTSPSEADLPRLPRPGPSRAEASDKPQAAGGAVVPPEASEGPRLAPSSGPPTTDLPPTHAGTPRPGPPGPPAVMGRTSPADPGLDEADRFFAAGRYDEAGRSYAALAQQNRLPADRRPHWAYCRWLEVVRRINRHPQSAREWDEIEAEVQSIQRLTPGNWYGEYLRSKIAESRRTRLGRRTSGASGHLVVRGSAPEESPAATPARRLPRLLGRSRGGAPAAAPAPRPDTPAAAPAAEHALNLPDSPAPPTASQAPAAAPDAGLTSAGSAGIGLDATPAGPEPAAAPSPRVADGSGAGASGSSEISWRIHESTNFRIYHYDLALARRAAEVAESVRAAQAKRWASPATRTAWSPRCELYLYPTGQAYGQATGQPENSPGISTMTNNGVLVLSRRMNLRGDNPQLLTSVLPHEVTHIVLADLFVARQIPRWADEGIAVLAEPLREQYLRSADLEGPLKTGQVFDLARLMSMDYPEPKDWSLYYAQSVSLTRYLVEQGPPERFLRFVQESQRSGPDTALRDVYQIAGLPALHDRWMVYARNQVAVATATLRGAESRPEQDVRR